MKIALIAITKHGVEHARELKSKLPGAEFWVSEKQKELAPDADGSFATIKDFTEQAWDKYDGLIYHVSLGAVVRTIAPYLKGKDIDPAVVTVDDGKRFVISVLSGHVGGANELTEQVAAALQSTPVVTTASDARAEMDWIPIRNVHRLHGRDELGGIYRAADVALVTPLRDGMNLVAKEFVAAQDESDPGVLILSRFAGAAAQMREALIVNPFSQEDVADAVRRALAMPLEERRKRWRALMDGVERDDIMAWRDNFVASLEEARHGATKPRPSRIAGARRDG